MPQLETFDVEVLEGGIAHRLRAKEGRHRYGVKLLDTHLKEAVRRDNLLLVKTYQFLTTQILKGIRVACVLRKSSGNECSPLDLDECDEFVSKNHLSKINLDACYFESGHHANFVVITQSCDLLSERQCLHDRKCCSKMNSFGAQHQCEQNWCLPEKALLWLVLKLRASSQVHEVGVSAIHKNVANQHLANRPRVIQEAQLRGPQVLTRPAEVQDESMIGGLRRSHRALKLIPNGAAAGLKIAAALDAYLDTPVGESDSEFLMALFGGDKTSHTCPASSDCVECRLENIGSNMRDIVLKSLGAPVIPPCYQRPEDVSTRLRPEVFKAWCQSSGDPDHYVAEWLINGAPAGLNRMPEHAGIFAEDEDPNVTHNDLVPYADGWENVQTSAESTMNDQVAWDEVTAHEAKGYLRRFASAKEVCNYLGTDFIESRLFVLEQEKHGVVHNRVLLDCKRSCVSGASQKSERVRLPKALDVAFDTLELRAHGAVWISDQDVYLAEGDDSEVSYAVLDISEAFWNIPLHPDERRFFVFQCRGCWFVILRTAQGSRSAPLTWGRTMSLSARMAQSTAPPSRLRIETYVDDPCMIVRGTTQLRRRIILRVICVWLALGHKMSWHKGQTGAAITWISVTYQITVDGLIASIKPELLNDVELLCKELIASNVFSLKRLRTLVGKAVHIASLLYMWRPFVRSLWSPLLAENQDSSAPPGCFWSKRIWPAAFWILAFLSKAHGAVSRTFSIETFLGAGKQIAITVDASPWGLGGVITENDQAIEYFSDRITDEDLAIHSIRRGDHRAQQCLEGLATLVALRTWSRFWTNQRVYLHVRGDSITALTMLLEMRAAGTTMMLIAREIALDISESVYSPSLISHIPGISNVLSDTLSRLHAPGGAYSLPVSLRNVPQAQCALRDRAFYRTLAVEDAWSARPLVQHIGN